MEMDRTCLKNAEEAWITKYRSVVKVPSIQQSRLMKVRVAINSVYNIVSLRVHRTLNHWTQARMQRPAPSSQPVLVTEPQSLARKMNQATMNQSTMNQTTKNQAESGERPSETATARSKTA
jgi:hypothetical protein